MKKRILYLTLEMDFGGLQRIVNQLIRRMDRKRFTPFLCCLDRGGVFSNELRDLGIEPYVLERRPGPFDLRLLLRLIRILKYLKIDIIHSQNGCSFYAALAGRLVGVKGIVHTDHGRLVPDKKNAMLEDRFSSYFIDQYVAVSEELLSYLAEEIRVNRRKLKTILNGVDSDRFKLASRNEKETIRRDLGFEEQDRIIGTVCRLDPIKNLEFMICSLLLILKNVPSAKLLIVGDGPSRRKLEETAMDAGLAKTVFFTGNRDDVEKIMPVFELYACTSFSEGTSMTILEAMSCGVPIVASAVGGNRSLVDTGTGSLFPPGNSDAFVKAITRLLLDAEASAACSLSSRERVLACYTVDRMVQRYEELYESLC
jgi:sugar transferase (PEP-CTERM/EpsH1 system associated)